MDFVKDRLLRMDLNIAWLSLILASIYVHVCYCGALQEPQIERFELPENGKIHHLVKRVIGGQGYEEGKWPWLVSLQGKVPTRIIFGIPVTYQKLYCGASLLNKRWILTAAHCFLENTLPRERSLRPRYWHAKLGEVELSSSVYERIRGFFGKLMSDEGMRHWYLHADKIVIHPKYDSKRMWQNDIALVKLEEDVPSGEEVQPHIRSIPLINSRNISFPSTGQQCIMKGWGCVANDGPVSGTAQEVVMPIVSREQCSSVWGIPATLRMCAGTGRLGICSGDSGGPLVCHNGNEWIQVGIASFTSASRPTEVPGVFTRVSNYVEWIEKVIRDDDEETLRMEALDSSD